MRALLIALAIPGFTLGLAMGAVQLVGGKPLPPSSQPTSVIWANRVYVNKHDLAQWLRSRGGSYQVWAANHPAIAETFEPSRTPTRRLASGSQSTTSGRSMMAIGLALASVLGLVMLAATLRRRLPVVARARRRKRGAVRRPRQLRRLDWKPSLDRSLVTRSVAVTRAALADLDRRLARPNRPVFPVSIRDPRPLRLPEIVRFHVPDIAFCAMSVLLAVVLGVSLALYLS